MPENCIRLQCRQCSDKPFHPEHHCYSIWPRTGNIICAHREPVKILLNSHLPRRLDFLQLPPPPSLQSRESVPPGGPTDEGWLRWLTFRTVCTVWMEVAHRWSHSSTPDNNTFNENFHRTARSHCVGILKYKHCLHQCQEVHLPLRWGSSKGLQPQSPTGKENQT